MHPKTPREETPTIVGLGTVETPRRAPPPLPREERTTPHGGTDFGDLREHNPATVSAAAALAGLDLQASGTVSLQAIVGQVVELRNLTVDGLRRNANAIVASEERTARRIDRSDHHTRKGLADLRAQILQLELAQYKTGIDVQQEQAERARLAREIAVTKVEAREAAEDAAEEITGQFRRHSSNAETFLEEAARQGLALAAQRERAELETKQKTATTDLEVRAEGWRTFIRVAAIIALAALGAGGWVWAYLSK